MLSQQRLLTPGPTPIPDRVRLAMAEPMIHHRKPEFKSIYQEVQKSLKQLFGTQQPVIPLSSSGTGAMTAAVINCFRPGETVLVAEAGKFGERWLQIAESQGLNIVHLSKPWGEAFEADDIRKALDEHPEVGGVLIQISETSTGVMHPVREIAAVTRERDVLLVADGISAVGISPCPMDEWGIDVLLTGSQKGLMVPPGLALIALSERAWKKAEQQQTSCFYFNLLAERANCLKNQTNFTSPVSLIIGLNEALHIILEEGLEELYKKQWALAPMTRTGVSAMGLELLAPAHYAWGLTAVRLPDGLTASAITARMTKELGVTVSSGQAPMKENVIRVAHMGWVDWGDLAAALHALAWCLPNEPKGYLEPALDAYHNALLRYPSYGTAWQAALMLRHLGEMQPPAGCDAPES